MIERVSFLDIHDQVGILSTYNAVTRKLFGCGECKKKYPQEQRKRLKGCHSPIEKPVMVWRNKINFYKCPSNFYSPLISELISVASHFKSGLLPYEGGLFEQPSKLIEVFNFVNSLMEQDELDRLEKQALEYKKQSQKARRVK